MSVMLFVASLVELIHIKLHKKGYVFSSLPEGRDFDREDIQTIEKVSPEVAIFDLIR